MKIDNLTNKTYEELRKIASKKKIKGRSKMNKKELIKSIKKIVKIMKGGDPDEERKQQQYRFYELIERIIPNNEFVKIMIYPKRRGINGKTPINFLLETSSSFKQPIEPQEKPIGAWLSNSSLLQAQNSRWINFVISENFQNRVYPPTSDIYVVEILNDPSKILRLQNPDELIEFTKKYGVSTRYGSARYVTMINWKKIQDDGYYGIDISPFMWDMAERFHWYRGWSCSSQCIWDYRGIVSVEKLDTTEQLREAGYTS